MASEAVGVSVAPGRRDALASSHGNGGAPRGPQVALLHDIRRIWATVLNVEQVGPDDDFFALGGTSLGLVTAAALVGERVGIDVPLHLLIAAATPAKTVDLIAELRAASDREFGDGITPFFPDWVVPLQTEGGGRPVFVFPGARGNRAVLAKDAQIAAMVGRVHPFYGFHREEAHAATDRDDWVAATAADYVTQIRVIQSRGPYLLYAICSGGPFAWEVARQLIDAGEHVAGVLFYETPLTVHPGEEDRPWYTPLGPPPGRAPAYAPRPLAVDLTLLMTEVWHAKGKSDGWFRVTQGQVYTVVMPGDTPGDHNLYYRREAMIAGHLRDWVARTEARWAAP